MAQAQLVLEDGSYFIGESVGVPGTRVGEAVFHTSMTGYQEILTDPSYCQQFINFTYPHIGNTGCNSEDNESDRVWASGAILNQLTKNPSNWRSQQSLGDFFMDKAVVAISGIDTRHLTQILREKGALRACLDTTGLDKSELLNRAREFAGLENQDLAKIVTRDKPINLGESSNGCHIVVLDFGVKNSILNQLVNQHAHITILPAQSSIDTILDLNPDGILLSNGPGDPAACDYAIETIKKLIQTKIPMMGICLGFQLMALALGAKTHKMKFGHHGANHPVQHLKTKQVLITSQNHGFCVDEASLPSDLIITHKSLFDQTIQGLTHKQLPIFGFQGHPEAGPGPMEATQLFQDFFNHMEKTHAPA